MTLFASDPTALEAFAPIRARGETVSLADLARDEVFLNADAAEDLGAAAGDRVQLLVGGSRAPFRVRDVVEFDGAGTDGPAVLALATAQRLLGVPGLVEHLLISNRGDELSGATLSDEVVAWLAPTMAGFGLEIDTEKKDGLERAGRGGQRVHVALHDVRQLLDRRRRPAHLPDLRHARGRASQ